MPTPSRPVPDTLLDLTGLYRLTVEQYRKMIDAGVLIESEPVELLEGYLVSSPRPLSPRASSTRTRVNYIFIELEHAGWIYHGLSALTLADSEPEPDFSIVRGREENYRTRFAGPGEIGLVGEVSESSLQFDRTEKGRIYARAGIPVYWIVNVADRQTEVYTNPDAPAYRTRTDYAHGDSVPLALDGQAVATLPVADLIP